MLKRTVTLRCDAFKPLDGSLEELQRCNSSLTSDDAEQEGISKDHLLVWAIEKMGWKAYGGGHLCSNCARRTDIVTYAIVSLVD